MRMPTVASIVTPLVGLAWLCAPTNAQDPCDGPIIVEASVPYVAPQGPVHRILVDGETVWLVQAGTAMRFQKVGGAWQHNSSLSMPTGSPVAHFDAHGEWAYAGYILYHQDPISGAWQPMEQYFGSNNGTGTRLGDFFILGHEELYPTYPPYYTVRGTALLGTQGFYIGWAIGNGWYSEFHQAASGARFALGYAFAQYPNYPVVCPILVGSLSGTQSSISAPTISQLPPIPQVQYYGDLTLSDNCVAVVAQRPGGIGTYQLNAWAFVGGQWHFLDTGDFWEDWVGAKACAATEDAVYVSHTNLAGEHLIAEFVLTPAGSVVAGREIAHYPSSLAPGTELFAAKGTLLVTAKPSTRSPSGRELVIMRTRPVTDCDGDGVLDCAAIGSGASADINGDSVPDDCQCISDLFADGVVNAADLGIVLSNWGSTLPTPADINEDGLVSAFDLGQVIGSWGPCQN